MKTLDERDIQINLSSVLTAIEQEGEVFLIYRNGKPVADLVPHKQKERAVDNHDVHETPEDDLVLQKLRPAIQAGLIVPHTKKLRKATMPKIKVSGKPLSQIIIEDRR